MAVLNPDSNAMVSPSCLLHMVAGQPNFLQTLWAKILARPIVIANPITWKYQEHK